MKSKIIKTLAIGSLLTILTSSAGYNYQAVSAENIDISKIAESVTYYRVIAGSFKNIDNAEEMVETLKKKGIDSYISTEIVKGEVYNRVIAGSFKEKENAKNMVSLLEDEDIDAFIVSFKQKINNEEDDKDSNDKNEEVSKYYLVIVGSYKNKDNAEARVKKLEKKKIDSYIVSKNIEGTTYYRVVVGTFAKEKNANSLAEKYEDLGYDVFIDTYYQ